MEVCHCSGAESLHEPSQSPESAGLCQLCALQPPLVTAIRRRGQGCSLVEASHSVWTIVS